VQQLELALRLPIAEAGALMPDGHPGYALPVGGVFAAHNAVAPAMVGVDIGCSM
jgi:tRNA-splicing ligase RtcB